MSKNSLTPFLLALKSADITKIQAMYCQSTTEVKVEVLKFLFQSAQNNAALYGHYQDITTLCLQAGEFPTPLLGAINSLEKFSFFSSPLILSSQIMCSNQQGNTILHIFLSTVAASENSLNYLKTLLLFESREILQSAISHRNDKQLTPLECYLAFNANIDALAIQELSALLGLIEVERRQTDIQASNAKVIESHLRQQNRLSDYKQFLLATYYKSNH
ncbi:hypothetical protein HUZ36_03650 [Pseudoalteromonas sp. McH1-7]|uniref:hypothetical protein n=1 Tax=Pseudoalteromonas sp. McH1-7 TaxID=2745574 RepID=UPI001590765D|nr:hypothetical protein [Pseudoalteromonas sp. McH1-7]NUZ09867.1 hypothetical protein [Pseudoalteromonas sp. McH1-7]